MAISRGQITLVDLHDVDIRNSEPTSPVLDQLWLDTSVVPNELKRWDGSKWVTVNDTGGIQDDLADLEQTVSTIGASVDVLAGEVSTKASQSDVTGLTGRISTVEQNIKPDKLVTEIAKTTTYMNDKIHVATTAPGSPVIGKLWLNTSKAPHALMRWTGTAWVKASPQDAGDVGAYTKGQVYTKEETATQVQMKFDEFQIGAENLIRGSQVLSDKFEAYQGSTITTSKEGVAVPEWGTDNATQIRTSSEGTSDLKARWVISSDTTFMNTNRDAAFSIWVKNNRTDQPVFVGPNISHLGVSDFTRLEPGESKKMVWIGQMDLDRLFVFELRAPTSGYYLDVTLWHPKWELGHTATGYSQHPDEMVTGITTISKDGVHVQQKGNSVSASMRNDGFRVDDGDKTTASFLNGTASVPVLHTDVIHGNVVNTHPGGVITIGPGRDYTSVNEALQAIGNAKYLLGDLSIRVYSPIAEDITIQGFSGAKIFLSIMDGGSIHGNILFYENSSYIYFYGYNKRELLKGRAYFDNSNGMTLRLNVDGNNSGLDGVVATYGSQIVVNDCDIVRTRWAVLSQYGATVTAVGNRGNIDGVVYNTYNGGIIHARGLMPTGTAKSGGSTGFFYDAGTTMGDSAFMPPANPAPTPKPTLMAQTFSPSKIETYSKQYGAISSHYPSQAAQNRWDSGTGYMEGRITFGGAVRNYINDRDSDTGLKVELRLRRYSGTNGPWSGVIPDKQFPTTDAFTAINKGDWGNWVRISPTLMPTSGYTFTFGSDSTGDKYAVWDAAQIRVTKTKNI